MNEAEFTQVVDHVAEAIGKLLEVEDDEFADALEYLIENPDEPMADEFRPILLLAREFRQSGLKASMNAMEHLLYAAREKLS